MRRSIVALVALCLSWGLAGCGEQPKDAINCRMKIKLSGGLSGTFHYGGWVSSKGCSGGGGEDSFDLGLSQDDLPDVYISVCGVGPAEIGDGLARMSIGHGPDSWVSTDYSYECESGPCPVTITKNDLQSKADPPFTGGDYWVVGVGHCDEPLVGDYDDSLEPIQVVGEFTFAGMANYWE